MEPSYNFDLRLSGTLAAVSIEVLDSPSGQTSAPTILPCTVSKDVADSLSTSADFQYLGSSLWRCAFGTATIAELWRASIAAVGPDGILRLRLVIDTPGLAALPWELLYDETLNRFLALDGHTPVTRFVRLPIAPLRWPPDRPLHLLFTGASPFDLRRLAVADEWAGIERVIAPLTKTGKLETQAILGSATRPDLLVALHRTVDIWHFAGHGMNDGLVFCDDKHKSAVADAFMLGQMLAGEGVRLAVLNACWSGLGGGQAASVAGALVRAGIPAVVAMQAEITDTAALAFAGAFYGAIAIGQSVDQAMIAGRKAIWAAGDTQWWTPALFMRTPEGHIWSEPPKTKDTSARTRELNYLEGLIEKYRYWVEKYTPLAGIAEVRTATTEGPRLDLPMLFMPTGFEKLEEHGFGLERRTELVWVDDLRDAVTRYKRLVLLGEPGSGKTTTLWRLAYDLAIVAKEDPTAPLPLMVPLGAFTGPESALVYAKNHFQDLGPDLPIYLRNKRVILLLDALNEMPQSGYKERVGRIQALLDQYPNTSVVVTCRALDYVETLRLEKLQVKPLDLDRQRTYLHRYLGVQAGEKLFWQMAGDEVEGLWQAWQETEGKWEQFVNTKTMPTGEYWWVSAAQRRFWELLRQGWLPPLWALGRNPFMLVMLAQVYAASEGILPQNRGRLFAAFVSTLFGREEKRCDPAMWMGTNSLRVGMARLAYAMQEAGEHGTAVEIKWAIEQIKQKGVDAERLMYLCASATLLDVSKSQVRFIHQLVQEYFAALALATRLQKGEDLGRYWPNDWTKPSGWEETFVLLAGILPEMTRLIEQLLLANPALAARCIAESGGKRPANHTVRQVQKRLISIATSEQAPVAQRHAAGNALNHVGDPRPGVGLRSDGLPDIVWCEVPAGAFIMGWESNAQALFGKETPLQRLWLKSFSISKYPITNAQFGGFVLDGGYTAKWRHCWTEAGWQWKGATNGPNKTDDGYNLSNYPAVMITWYEAVAFSNWLSEKLGRMVSLPTEAQWERAARHTDARWYPWGDDLTPDHANYYATGIGEKSTVGIFTKGGCRCGAQDMCGNIWEWCLTKWREDYNTPPDDEPEGDALRVLRGGSFDLDAGGVRCGVRNWNLPDSSYGHYGFRVVCTSIPHTLP